MSIKDRQRVPFGVSPSREAWIILPAGLVMAFDHFEHNPAGTSYIRFLDKNGGEVGYWNSDEWGDTPEEVMGAIMGCAMTYEETTDPQKFYQFGPDAVFPEGQQFQPYGQ